VIVIGVDENGLGPLLGPLVVTGAAFSGEGYDPALCWSAAHLVAGDSKLLFSARRMARAEGETRAWLAAFGIRAATFADLVAQVLAAPRFAAPCPDQVPPVCVPDSLALPHWSEERAPAEKGSESRLPRAGIAPLAIRSHSLCPGAFNLALSQDGRNKLRLDFELMVDLIEQIAAQSGEEVLALCGKVGGTGKYGPWLDRAFPGNWQALEESPALSRYRIGEQVQISFSKSAEKIHLPVAVASMVGKYLRELWMQQLNHWLGSRATRPASGYRDRVTAAFVEASAGKRREIGLDDTCFFRQR
jgi:ribonuclease HII